MQSVEFIAACFRGQNSTKAKPKIEYYQPPANLIPPPPPVAKLFTQGIAFNNKEKFMDSPKNLLEQNVVINFVEDLQTR